MASDSLNAEGMYGHGKLIKRQLSKLMPRIETQPILVVLLNQIYTSGSDFKGNALITSGGGWGIKHYAHLRFKFKSGKDEVDEDNNLFVTSRTSELDIVKSKLSPLLKGINMVIDITKGGAIDSVKSMMAFAQKLDVFELKGTRYVVKPEVFQLYPQFDHKFNFVNSEGKSYYWSTYEKVAQQRPKFVKFMQLLFIKMISEHYSYQAEICKPYAEQLIKEMEDPEYVTREDGSVIDLWTGEVLRASASEAADFLQSQLDDTVGDSTDESVK